MKLSKQASLLLRILAIVVVIAIAWSLRSRAVNLLPVDYDEDDYMRAAQEFTQLIRARDWAGFQEANYRTEHPPLSKIVFGFGLLSAPEAPLTPDQPTSAEPDKYLPKDLLHAARNISAIFGTITVALLALLNPISGALLAFHTFTIKYDSQVMLEALPALTSLIMVMAYLQSRKQKNKTSWLLASAVFLGLTAASKYMYCLIAIAILVDWFLDAKEKNQIGQFLRQGVLWGIIAIVIFFAADPYLWPDPLGRLKDSVLYHAGYAAGASEVQRANYPFWQPFVWLSMSPSAWHDGVFVIAPDLLITILGAFGLARLWKKERVYVLWLGVAIFFLLLWPTKWPQYILVLTVPLSLAAAEGIKASAVNLFDWWANRNQCRAEAIHSSSKETSRALPWLIPGLIFFTMLTILPLIYQLGMSTTTLNGMSLRDGLHGGIWREVWGGITGQIKSPALDATLDQSKVHYVGLANYSGILRFINPAGTTFFNFFWTVLSVSLQSLLGISAALLLSQTKDRTRKIWQTIFILPWAIPEAVGTLLWLNIFAPFNGWLTLAVNKFGPNIPFGSLVGWEKNPNQVLLVMLICALWYGFPFIMLAASAGLKMLPKDVYDAAAIDGATYWQTFRYVTLPLLQPLVLPAILIRAIFAFNQFYLFQMFIPYYQDIRMATLSSFSYYTLFRGSEFSTSATINIIALIFLSVFVLLLNRWSKATAGVTYA